MPRISALGLLLVASPMAAQRPVAPVPLPPIEVTVTRTATPASTLSAPVTVVDSATLHRGPLTPTLDQALALVPGVIAQNRWNYSLDQRISIRGFGSRAAFGLRGIKVLLDGVPQTLPDGQGQLTNVDLSLVDQVQVLRGAASSLDGNASGGVIAFTTRGMPSVPWTLRTGVSAGTFGTMREEASMALRRGPVGGTVSYSRFSTDGFRQHSGALTRQLSLAADWVASAATRVTVRLEAADNPHAYNPGALTLAELGRNRDSASAASILRGADKAVTQRQLALGLHQVAGRVQLDATVYGLVRDLDNPIAAPPPPLPSPAQPQGADAGTLIELARRSGGIRTAATATWRRITLTGGLDGQWLRDDRQNWRSTGGTRTDGVLLNQLERVSELGAFVQGAWAIDSRITLRGGIRRDANRFGVADRLTSDGDASGHRTMGATSGNAGIAARLAPTVTAWADIATAFETPTTTELANRPPPSPPLDGAGGFNPALGPERSVSTEIGIRRVAGALVFDVATYRIRTRDAIVPWSEVNGRSYYRNAGAVRTQGLEASATWTISSRLRLRGTWTHTDAIFTDYHIADASAVDTLDGHHLAGIPRQVAHLRLEFEPTRGVAFDVDHGWTSSMPADDANRIVVPGWGLGVTDARLRWRGRLGRVEMEPFVAVTNLANRHYVGSVAINGMNGRVFEPAAGRTLTIGVSAEPGQ